MRAQRASLAPGAAMWYCLPCCAEAQSGTRRGWRCAAYQGGELKPMSAASLDPLARGVAQGGQAADLGLLVSDDTIEFADLLHAVPAG